MSNYICKFVQKKLKSANNASQIYGYVHENELSCQEAAWIKQTAGHADDNKSNKRWNVRTDMDGEDGD